MSITTNFIKHLEQELDHNGITLMNNFLVIFSRFEYALKKTITYANPRGDQVHANWDKFAQTIRSKFDKDKTEELLNAVTYLLNNPPKVQTLINNQMHWRDRVFNKNEPELKRIAQHIRDVRNNFFHGGKFQGIYQPDISRNYILLDSALIILDHWLLLEEEVSSNFSDPIS